MKILDKVLDPYFIELSSDNYNVLEKTGKKDKKDQDVFRQFGHYTSVENALKKIQRLLVETDNVYSIKEYLKAMKGVKVQIENNN